MVCAYRNPEIGIEKVSNTGFNSRNGNFSSRHLDHDIEAPGTWHWSRIDLEYETRELEKL